VKIDNQIAFQMVHLPSQLRDQLPVNCIHIYQKKPRNHHTGNFIQTKKIYLPVCRYAMHV
jgi:hypothetical protein